ncbi:MAG: hypothetical protein QOD26_2165 [Betaproteobacteria bacterium]|jgi:hypothetical protein|nr:hypothetical protein [Betaproteobacteria bacterium]
MATRRIRKSRSLAAQSIELGMAVPQVIAHRLARMDPTEVHRMGSEKVAAFNEAWAAMAMQAALENQKLALSVMQSFWFPWLRPPKSVARQLSDAGLSIFGKGMAPIRRRAVANAKRLGTARRRSR